MRGYGERFATEVIIPAGIVFESGKTYRLWLLSRNGAGSSEPGSVQVWTAV